MASTIPSKRPARSFLAEDSNQPTHLTPQRTPSSIQGQGQGQHDSGLSSKRPIDLTSEPPTKRARVTKSDGRLLLKYPTPPETGTHVRPSVPTQHLFPKPAAPSTIKVGMKRALPPSSSDRPGLSKKPRPLPTPPSSAQNPSPPSKPRGVALTLIIPHDEPDKAGKALLARRKGAAKRWGKEGKLQKPFPKKQEITAAYNLKLMRHYPAVPAASSSKAGSASATPAPISSEPNFIKPVINKSARVTALLKNFTHPLNPPPRKPYMRLGMDQEVLYKNIHKTATDYAEELAWKAFSSLCDRDKQRNGREAMIESALPVEELEKEDRGIPNMLPDWKKYNTGRYVPREFERY